MTAMIRAAISRVFGGAQRPRRPEPPWRVGESVRVAACDRRTGRPERPLVDFGAVVTAVDEEQVTVSVGAGAPYLFSFCDGWETCASPVSPWRLLHDRGRWGP